MVKSSSPIVAICILHGSLHYTKCFLIIDPSKSANVQSASFYLTIKDSAPNFAGILHVVAEDYIIKFVFHLLFLSLITSSCKVVQVLSENKGTLGFPTFMTVVAY